MRFRGHFGRAAQLATLAIAGQGLFYLLTVVLAQRLGVDGFEAYSVAVAAVVLLASFATWGLEKYAMRVLPSLFERGDWARARGYVRFGLRRTLWTSLLAATVLGVGWSWWATDTPAAARLTVAAGCLALPAVALVPRFGATGAAIAYAVSMCGMYGVFWRVAVREVVRLRADAAGGGASEIPDP